MPPPPSDLRHLDPRVWRACAGSSVQIPALHSRVFYFPQGHIQHSCRSAPVLSTLAYSKPLIPCIVSAVHFLADPVTDEVFARILLLPVLEPSGGPNQFVQESMNGSDDGDNKRILSFAKILTPSDANNGGGFSVPRFCADSIFPPLNYQADPPVQTLSVCDVHGAVFEFRHIYRGTPRRHLLTTGWSKFVNQKKLIAGDSVVFMRDSTNGQMFIGVRRSVKRDTGGDYARWREPISGGGTGSEGRGVEGFSEGGRERVTLETVAESVERAAKGLPFEVVYYPRAGWADFVVRAESVEAALSISWVDGMRVKMAVETEDSSRMSWFQGTVDSAAPERGCWGASPWGMLQVTWDEPEVLPNAKRVSPWQVEFLAPSPLHATFPPAKKLKFPENSGVTDGDGDIFFPISGFTNSTMGQINSSPLNHYFPAGMQGARQENSSLLSSSNLVSESNPITCNTDFSGNYMMPKLKRVSTELNIGSVQSDNLSPGSQSSVPSFSTELVDNKGCNSTKVGNNSLQLFGKIIYMKEPSDSGFDDVGSPESNETEGVHNELDLSLKHHYSEFCLRG
ncbi:hypothetical protein SLA2020_154580 [Shorea laevis]